jgi:hypothetical protein
MDIIDVFIIIALMVFASAICIGVVYMMVYYQHPDDDTNECIWLYRIAVVSAFTLALFMSLALPIDASTTAREDTSAVNFNMSYFWWTIEIFYVIVAWIL